MATRRVRAMEPQPILSTEEACDTLRIYNDDGENTVIVDQLVEGIPGYIYTSTGYPYEYMGDPDKCNPLVKTLAKLILQLWYNPDGTDNMALTRTVNSVTKTVKAMTSQTAV